VGFKHLLIGGEVTSLISACETRGKQAEVATEKKDFQGGPILRERKHDDIFRWENASRDVGGKGKGGYAGGKGGRLVGDQNIQRKTGGELKSWGAGFRGGCDEQGRIGDTGMFGRKKGSEGRIKETNNTNLRGPLSLAFTGRMEPHYRTETEPAEHERNSRCCRRCKRKAFKRGGAPELRRKEKRVANSSKHCVNNR